MLNVFMDVFKGKPQIHVLPPLFNTLEILGDSLQKTQVRTDEHSEVKNKGM